MSADSVDDLQAAEDPLGANNLLDGYCRPTCQWLEEGECDSGGEEGTCGCPCGHGTNEESDEHRHGQPTQAPAL